jgi:hypothetical protein
VHEQRREHVALDALFEKVVDALRKLGDIAREGDGHRSHDDAGRSRRRSDAAEKRARGRSPRT